MLVLMTCLRIHVDETLSSGVDGSATGKPRSRRLRPSVAKCVPREADRVDGVGAKQRPLGFWGNDRGRRASPGPLSGQRKPRPRLSTWVGTASSCTKLPGRVPVPVKPLGQARDGRQQRPTDRADAFAPCRTPLISSTDAASSTSDAAGGRGTRHPSAVALPDGERARVEFVRSRGRRARATAALVGVASCWDTPAGASDYMPAGLLRDSLLY